MKLSLFCFLAIFIFSCNQKDGPVNTLKKYIDYRFSSEQSKEGILEKTTGKLHDYVSVLEGNTLDAFMKSRNVKKKKLSIKSKKCTEDICFITYIVAYNHFSEGKNTFDIEVKKIAELRLIEDVWKIYDVNNVKTYMESKEELAP